MTNMTAIPIHVYDKNQKVDDLGPLYVALGMSMPYQVCKVMSLD